MSEIEYSLLFLKRKLKDIPFQVWGYNHYHKKKNLLYSNGIKEPLSPPFHDSKKETAIFRIRKQNDENFLYFYYPEGNQVCVCICHPFIILTSDEIEYLYYFISLSLSKEIIQAKNTELNNVVDSIRSITSSLDLDEVLEKIINNALKVIPAADAGYLLLYDDSTKLLIPKAPVGFNENIYHFKVKVGESITGKVFEDGEGRIFNSKQCLFDEMNLNNITKENYYYITSASKTTEAAMCVPISLDDKRIGVIIIHQWYKKKELLEHDLKLLQGFAAQAAVAIQNAQFYSQANKRLIEITELSIQLKEKNIQLQKRHEVHAALTNISLQNKGIETIVREFNHMVEPPVSFLNAFDNNYYSNDRTRAPLSIYEMKKIFTKRRQPLHVEIIEQSKKTYYLFPIYNGNVFLGCLITNVVGAISRSDQMTLEQGSSLLALELLTKQTVTEIYYKKTHEQFEGLLNYQDTGQLTRRAKDIGLNPSSNWLITVFEISNYSDIQLLELEVHQLISKIKNILQNPERLIYGFHNKIVILISILEQDNLNHYFQKILSLKTEWENNDNQPFRGGISAIYKGLENIKKCYDEANKSLTYLANRNRNEIICYEDIGLNKLFLNQSSQEIEHFINEVFGPLLSENDRSKDLEETLLIYIKYNRSATKTAEKLHIHINTLYQRLKKIEDLLQIELNNNEDTLKIQLACHLRETYRHLLA
ncbi:helix-turn-helix domain-containing protein [Alkalihalobacillus deserti]|uniref:helix-turn-helix domain-containing protein n=1 Tax=Alkalihalobacillus deserti TaxID=2879466 RepID=UPI001D13EC48|nr:helix-turn-helix domain-containing protein [Alkalihalobacillus deserti]